MAGTKEYKMKSIFNLALLSLFLLFLSACSHQAIQETYWKAGTGVALDEERKGNLEEAETKLRVALGRATRIEDEEKIAHSLYNLGAFYRRQNRLVEAVDYLNKALKLNDKVFGPTSKITGLTLAQLAATHAMEDNLFEGRQYADRLKPLAKYYSDNQALFVERVLAAYVIDIEKYNKKVAELKPLADSGDPEAQIRLAKEYYGGPDAKELMPEILALYEKAAGQGSALAQYILGVTYTEGWGVSKDDVKAREYYKKSAENNYHFAQYNYAIFLLHGRGGPKNEIEAWDWMKKSSAQGNPDAQRMLTRHNK